MKKVAGEGGRDRGREGGRGMEVKERRGEMDRKVRGTWGGIPLCKALL